MSNSIIVLFEYISCHLKYEVLISYLGAWVLQEPTDEPTFINNAESALQGMKGGEPLPVG